MARYERRSWGPAIGVILLLLIVIIALGAWRGWWGFNFAADREGDKLQMEAQVDRERIGEDVEAIGEATREATESAAVAAQLESVRGTVTEIRPEVDELVLETEAEPLTVRTSDATEFVVAEAAASLDALQVGHRVLVTYRERDGVNNALKVEVSDEAAE